MRRLALAVAVLLLSLGTGLVVYGVSVDRGDFRSPLGLSLWQQPAEVTAWGAGTLVAGTASLPEWDPVAEIDLAPIYRTVQAVRIWRGLRDQTLTDFAQLPND